MMKIRPTSKVGFTLIELAIVLGIAGILFGGLWRLLSVGNQQLRDQTTASAQGQLISSAKTFLVSSDGQNFMIANANCAGPGNQCLPNSNFPLPLPKAATQAGTVNCYNLALDTNLNVMTAGQAQTWCSDLPPGFSAASVNSFGQSYGIRVLRDATAMSSPPNTYSYMILSSGGDIVPDVDGGRITSMIGGDGGFLYFSDACTVGNTSNTTACGAFGTWSSPVNTYGFANPATGGYIASRTYYAPEQNSSNVWLAREYLAPDLTFAYNTMTTDLFMGTYLGPTNPHPGTQSNFYMATTGTPGIGGSIYMSSPGAIANGGSINMQGGNLNMNVTVLGVPATSGGGNVDLQGGTVVSSGSGNGAIRLTNATQATGLSVITASMPCNILSYDAIKGWVDGSDNPCGFAITTSSITVPGLVSANGFYAGTFVYNSSDARLKTDIHPLKNSLDDIMRLKPVSFTLKESGKESMGVIAQDIEKVYPQLVGTGDKGLKNVAYDGLIAPLIDAVQELKNENDALRVELKAEEFRQKELEKRLEDNSSK